MAKAHLGSVEYILLELPAALGEQIYHVLLREAGYSTKALDPKRGDAAAQLAALHAVEPLATFNGASTLDTATLAKWDLQ